MAGHLSIAALMLLQNNLDLDTLMKICGLRLMI
jgi:hypothetical protein